MIMKDDKMNHKGMEEKEMHKLKMRSRHRRRDIGVALSKMAAMRGVKASGR